MDRLLQNYGVDPQAHADQAMQAIVRVIEGTFQAMPRTARVQKPVRVRVRFGETIPAECLLPGEHVKEEAERHRLVASALRERIAKLQNESDRRSE